MPVHRPKVGFESQSLRTTIRRPIGPSLGLNKTGNACRQYRERIAGQSSASLAPYLSSSGDSMARAIPRGRTIDSKAR